MERGCIHGQSRLEDDLAPPERRPRQLSQGCALVGERTRRNRVGGHGHDTEVVGGERVGPVNIPRRDNDRAPLRTHVIERPSERTGRESKHDESALADQSWSAGDRTTTVIAPSTVR